MVSCTVVIVVAVVGDVNDIVGTVVAFTVVIVVGDCKVLVVTVVFLLSFLLL